DLGQTQPVERLAVLTEVALDLPERARLEVGLLVLQVPFQHRSEYIGLGELGSFLLRLGINAGGNEADKTLGFPRGTVRRPGRAVPADCDKPSPATDGIFQNIEGVLPLSADTKATDGVLAGVPDCVVGF